MTTTNAIETARRNLTQRIERYFEVREAKLGWREGDDIEKSRDRRPATPAAGLFMSREVPAFGARQARVSRPLARSHSNR